MARTTFRTSAQKGVPVRRKPSEVLGVDDIGASDFGSTFHKLGMSCWREFGLADRAKLKVTAAKEALDRGWVWHVVMEHYYGELFIDPTVPDKAVRAGFNIIADLQNEPGYAEDFDKLSMMFETYLDNYPHDKWRIIAVEEELIDNRLPYSARLDLIVEEDDGMWIVEHKTTRAMSADLADSYQLDIQILGQVYLMLNVVDLSKYPPFKGVKVNLITTSHKVPRCERVHVYPSKYHLQGFVEAVADQHAMRLAAEHRGWPQSLGKCSGYARGYSKCQFFDLCHAHPTTSVQDWIDQEDPPIGFIRTGSC